MDSLLHHIKTDPYKVLGIQKGVSLPEIKKAYFKLIRKHPPEQDPEGFKIIRSAYDQLRSEERKKETDFLLFEDVVFAKDFQEKQDQFTNIQEDLIDMEVWELIENYNK